MDSDREKLIRSDSDFQGYTRGKLEDIALHIGEIKESFSLHLKEEMEELKVFNSRLGALENWRIKTTASAGVVGAIVSVIVTKFL